MVIQWKVKVQDKTGYLVVTGSTSGKISIFLSGCDSTEFILFWN